MHEKSTIIFRKMIFLFSGFNFFDTRKKTIISNAKIYTYFDILMAVNRDASQEIFASISPKKGSTGQIMLKFSCALADIIE